MRLIPLPKKKAWLADESGGMEKTERDFLNDYLVFRFWG